MSTGPQKPNSDFVPVRKHRTRDSQFAWEQTLEKARTPVLVLVAAALAVLVAWLFTGDRRATRQTEDVLPFEQTEVLRRRSLDLEASFEKIRLERTELLPADIELLAQAQDRYDGALAIEYLQRGPTEWRLRLVRTTPPV